MEFPLISTDTKEGEVKLARLLSLRDVVTPILANNLQTEFTDHTVEHSDNVAKLVAELASIASPKLTNHEAFVVYAACYLHDIGMQYQNAGSTSTIQQLQLKQLWNNLSHEEQAAHLRKVHPSLSAEMVTLSVNSATPPTGFQLIDEDDPAEIAALCEAHGLYLPQEEDRYAVLMGNSNEPIRMGLLSGLLRMADILEESRRRAKRRKADTLLLPLESQVHWWRHYYTKDVTFDSNTRRICLKFDFPRSKRIEYSRVVPKLQVPEIQKELRRHDHYFIRYGVSWVIDEEVGQNPYGTAEDMPTEVFALMSSWLQQNAEREADANHRALLNEYEAAQPAINEMLDGISNLPETVTPAEKAAKLENVGNQLLNMRANRVAHSVLDSAYELYKQTGDTKNQLRVGLHLIPLMFNQNMTYFGTRMVIECEDILDSALATQEQKLEIAQWKAKSFDSQYFADAVEAYRSAIVVAQSQQQNQIVEELKASLNEFLFLDNIAGVDSVLNSCSSIDLPSIKDIDGKPFPQVRTLVVTARLFSQNGEIGNAIKMLHPLTSETNLLGQAPLSWVFLLNAQADILHLSGRYEEALALLNNALKELSLGSYAHEHLALQRNRLICGLSFANPEMVRWNNELNDIAEIVEESNEKAISLLNAFSFQQENKHREALASFWQELRLAYAAGDWQRYWKAEEYLSTEYLKIGQLDDAAHHAIRGLSYNLMEQIGNSALTSQNKEVVRKILSNCSSSNLAKHFIASCKLLEVLADAIPDNMIEAVVKYVLPYAQTNFIMLTGSDTVRPAWRVLKAISISPLADQAEQIFNHMQGLELERMGAMVREEMLQVLFRIVPVLKGNTLAQAASLVLSLTDNYPKQPNHEVYYDIALSVVLKIADTSNEEIKSYITNHLFPPGNTQTDITRLQLLPRLKNVEHNLDWIKELIYHAATTLRRQVSEMPDTGVPPQVPGASMTQFQPLPNGNRKVISLLGQQDLRTAMNFIPYVDHEAASQLFDACLEMLALECNLVANRILNVEALRKLKDKLNDEQINKLWEVVFPLAQGNLISEIDKQRSIDAKNPLSAFRINLGNLTELQGEAIITLAQLESRLNEIQRSQFVAIEAKFIVSPDTELRSYALRASRFIESLNDIILTALICSIRDPDYHVTIAGYSVLCEKNLTGVNDVYVGLIQISLKLAVNSQEVNVRRWAAFLTRKILEWLPADSTFSSQFIELQQQFSEDICRSVRVLSQTNATEQQTENQENHTAE